MYELVPPEPDAKWIVAAATVQPLFGETRLARVNLTTGEIEAIP
jgi:hypothetical protein